MNTQNSVLLNGMKIGVLGCGHLGQAVALSLIHHGVKKENLFISFRGNPATYQKLLNNGLTSCIAENKKILNTVDLLLICLKPQDITGLEVSPPSKKVVVGSCMAGASIDLIKKVLKTDVYRMMFSGPDTILGETGVAATYPHHEYLNQMIQLMNLKQIKIVREADLDIFTAGVCMPAALLEMGNLDEVAQAIQRMGGEFPLLVDLYNWAVKALPHFQNNTERDIYINRMITRGGITDAILRSLRRGDPLDLALRNGMARSSEISGEIERSILPV